jgi:hypothetical protein
MKHDPCALNHDPWNCEACEKMRAWFIREMMELDRFYQRYGHAPNWFVSLTMRENHEEISSTRSVDHSEQL